MEKKMKNHFNNHSYFKKMSLTTLTFLFTVIFDICKEQFLEYSDIILPHCKEQKSQRFDKWKNEIEEMIKH